MPGQCCPGKPVSKRLVIDGQEVGISGLDEIVAKGLENLERTDVEQRAVLLKELKERNYVPEAVEQSYLEAVWVYFKEQRAKKLGWVEEKYHGIPREEIHWCPTIDDTKCNSCGACAKFCKRGVYTFDDGPHVTNPYRCVVSCTGCQKTCKDGAISFPTLVDLREEMKNLRRKHGILSG
jgi:NAD-dependent dihydropyrimidine dehydrogenase PreA subunit